MADFPAQSPGFDIGFGGVITPASPACPSSDWLSMSGATLSTSAIFPTANLAIYIPFIVNTRAVAQQMSHQNGTVVSGNVDVGIYDERANRLVSKGSTAQAGTSAIQVHDITDTELVPGVYYMAIAMDNNVGTLLRGTFSQQPQQAFGHQHQLTAFPLPNPATFATVTQTYIPSVAVHFAAVA